MPRQQRVVVAVVVLNLTKENTSRDPYLLTFRFALGLPR